MTQAAAPTSPTPEEVALGDLFVALEQHMSLCETALAQNDSARLPQLGEQVLRGVQQFQQMFQRVLPQDRVTWAPRLRGMQARLTTLNQQMVARQVQVGRGLNTLFPTEQLSAYERLGKPGARSSGVPRVSNNTSYKA